MSLYFQPIVDVERGKIVAFEALARWDSPMLGRVAPDVFIRVAERSDLINKLTAHAAAPGARRGQDMAERHPRFVQPLDARSRLARGDRRTSSRSSRAAGSPRAESTWR